MTNRRNGWFSGALFLGILSGLAWFAPFGDQALSRKGRAIAAAFDAVVQPAIDAVGNAPIAAAFAAAALFMLWRGLGSNLPRLPEVTLEMPRFGRERPVPEDADEPSAPLQRKRDLSRLAVTDETTPYAWPESTVEADPVSPLPSSDAEPVPSAQAAPVDEPQATWTNPFATEQAHVEYLVASHDLDGDITRDAMLASYRKLEGPDATLSDAVYEKAVARIQEQQRKRTPHSERVDPIALVRKPREKGRDWRRDRSWLGGLPRLGQAEWPRNSNGVPMPFVLQVDLAELRAAGAKTPLPDDGSLAFFIGEGAVLHVPTGAEETPAPPDLPPAFEEGGYPLPEKASASTHDLFPFWPVEPIRLAMPEGLPAPSEETDENEAIWTAQSDALHAQVAPSKFNFALSTAREAGIAGADAFWWYGAMLLRRKIRPAPQLAGPARERYEQTIARGEAALASLDREAEDAEQRAAALEDTIARNRTLLERLVRGEAELPRFLAQFDALIEGRQAWSRTTADETAVIEDIAKALFIDFKDLVVPYGVPRNLDTLRALCIERIITGDEAMIASLPDDMLAFINANYRLPTNYFHRMFGLGDCIQYELYNHLSDHLLLQLAPDDFAEMNFPDVGIWQFWISPEDLDARRWEKAALTFECG